jgi:hypothetical protein
MQFGVMAGQGLLDRALREDGGITVELIITSGLVVVVEPVVLDKMDKLIMVGMAAAA